MRKNLKHEQKARKRVKDFIRTTVLLLGCQVCGERDFACIDLHHQDPSTKESDVRTMIKNRWGQEKIKKELTKCVPLCSNCHRKYHANRLQYNKDLIKIDPIFLEGIELVCKITPWESLLEQFDKSMCRPDGEEA